MGVEKISGSGTVRVEIYREDASAEVFNTTQLDYRSGTAGASPYLGTVTVSPGETIAFRITETGGANAAVARAFVTYGFGEVGAGLLPTAL